MTVSADPHSGRPRDAAAGSAPEQALPQQRGRRRSSKGRGRRNTALILALAGAAVLAAACVFGYRFVSANVLGPQAVVEDYLAALASGDQAAAHSLLPDTNALVPENPAVYAAAGQRITGYEILGQDIGAGRAAVQAFVDWNGQRSAVEFALREAGSLGLVFTQWQLEPTAARTVQVQVPPGTGQIRINGADIPLPPGEDSAEVLLLPGSYLLEGPRERYLSYGAARTVLVRPGMPGNPNPVRLRASATAELAAEVQAQADAYLAQCLDSREAAPEGCPNAAYSAYGPERIRDVQWVLERAPEYRITGTPESGLTVYAAGGKARVQYQEDTSGAGRWESRSDLVNISFGSGVEASGESLGLDFRP